MKVLDLQCRSGHVFEGWFASEDDFQGQRQRFEDSGSMDAPPPPRRGLRGNRRDPASVWVGLGIGFENGIEVRQLIPMLCRGADIPGSELGRIELLPRVALVGCTPEAAERILQMRMQWKRRPIRVWEADPPRGE